jgi:hypothetical protein
VVHYEHLLERARPDRHIVHFYSADELPLVRNLSLYFGAGLHRGDTALIVTTPQRREALFAQLRALRVDADAAIQSGQMVIRDAGETLSQILVGGQADWERFRGVLEPLVRALQPQPGHLRLRVYGEMVDLLWRSSRFRAAVRLEGMWNRLRESYPCQLLCACGDALSSPPPERLEQLRGAHTHHIAEVH